MKQFRKWDKLA